MRNYIISSSRKKEKKEVGIRLSLAIVASPSSVSFRRRNRRGTNYMHQTYLKSWSSFLMRTTLAADIGAELAS